ncbi:MAG: thioredoxin family protein [Weeksellaceae bacterium]|jgi:thioredoxin-related protein|nr:thioredoxin family protein [Weeksellaceae bacterium]
MKKFGYLAIVLFLSMPIFAQTPFNLYNPDADAKKDITKAVEKAKAENKHVFIQIGGNWCGWCKLFHELTTTDEDLKKYITENFEVVHLNYSKENQNQDVLEALEFPQRFGFPVFVILDENGKRIHTQNSAYLEEGEGHSKEKVLEFLLQWSPKALNPELYKK